MEKYGIFGQLATESHEDTAVAVEANIIEEIASEEAYADALNIQADIESGIAAMAQATVAADRLEAQVSHEDMMLAKPEQITVSAVALAQESLATTAMLLGATTADLAPAVSQEAAEANPVSAMQISQEGAKDFLKKVIESIKAIFRKVMNSAKKLYVKLVVAMDGTDKKADKLIKHIKKDLSGAKPEKTTFDEKTSEKMYKAVPVLEIDNLPAPKDILNPFSGLNDLMEITDKAVSKIEELDSKNLSEADFETQKQTILDGQLKAGIKALSTMTHIDIKFAEDNTNFTAASDNSILVVTSYNGTKIHAIEIYSEDVDKKLIVKPRVLSIDTSNYDGKKLSVAPLSEITTMLTDIKVAAKGFGRLKDDAMKFIEKADKKLDKLAKSSSDSKIGYAINKLKAGNATLLRDLSVTSALNSVLDEVKLTKSLLSFASKHVNMYSKKSASM